MTAADQIAAINAKAEAEHWAVEEKREKHVSCPNCRGYRLERQWCHVCNGSGFVKHCGAPMQGSEW